MDYKKKYLKYKLKYLNIKKLYGGAEGSTNKRNRDNDNNAVKQPKKYLRSTSEKFSKAIREKDLKTIKTILDEDDSLVNAKNRFDNTALHIAAKFGDIEIVDILVGKGANVNIQNKLGYTALRFAAENGHIAVVNKLLDYEAVIDACNNTNLTALMVAANNGHSALVNVLLERKTDVNAQSKYDWTALMFAAENGRVAVVNVLLEGKAKINAQNNNGMTALMFASKNGHDSVVNALLEGGANINAQNNDNWTALMYVATIRNNTILEIFYNNDTKPSSILQNSNGSTALMCAIMFSFKNTMSQNFKISDSDVNFINNLIRFSALFGEEVDGEAESLENLLAITDSGGRTAQMWVNNWEVNTDPQIGINFDPLEGAVPYGPNMRNIAAY